MLFGVFMYRSAIITPTFQDHFPFILLYLKSFDTYVEDKFTMPIYFTISRFEENNFTKMIAHYIDNLDIRILIFEDILTKFGITKSPETLLNNYGKFSFQTLKKFYTMLYTGLDRFLVLDSESMWIRPTNMTKIFDNFFSAPFISHSDIEDRWLSPFTNAISEANNLLLGQRIPYWFLENFVWFYERRILNDMYKDIGTFIQMVQKVYNAHLYDGLFEIAIYQAYLYIHREKYGYKDVDISHELTESVPKKILDNYIKMHNKFFCGNCGLLEHAIILLDKENINILTDIFCRLHFNIIRCEKINNYTLQKYFIDIVKPNILAASQKHCFGLNENTVFFLKNLILYNNSWITCKQHIKFFLRPIKYTLLWLFSPLFIIKYMAKTLYNTLSKFIYNLK
jgi:hypothetical protein